VNIAKLPELLGDVAEPAATDGAALQRYKDKLDERGYQLNAASVKLTKAIREVWVPDTKKGEADKLQTRGWSSFLRFQILPYQ
jgi:hypothetical protein